MHHAWHLRGTSAFGPDPARACPNLTIEAETLADRIDVEIGTPTTSRGLAQAATTVLTAGASGACHPSPADRPGLAHDLPVGET